MPIRAVGTSSRPALFLAGLLIVTFGAASPIHAEPGRLGGFRALSGAEAATFQPPTDTRVVRLIRLGRLGVTLERYQQYVGRWAAAVEGAQLTVVRRGGQPVLVVGAHFPRVAARTPATGLIGAHAAIAAAARDESVDDDQAAHWPGKEELQRGAELWLDPHTGRSFYRVETRGLATRQLHVVDAASGEVVAAFDALAHDHGTGVKGDRKSVRGIAGTADDLTRKLNGDWRMRSVDDRLRTFDMGNRWGGSLVVARDTDNRWTLTRQRSTVDAQYYARTTDDFLLDRFGFDVLSEACGYGQIRSVVRFGENYANAFWNGSQLVYGEGDGSFRALSGAQDVVAHELLHAVTECTSDLDYWNEPGALNEAFSDVLAVAAEWALAEPLTSNCRRAAEQSGCPDWWIGEDVWRGGGSHGIRSLADPAAGNQPSHYSQRYVGSADNGGVHVNSGIAAHAFYLLAEGGRNARCSGAHDPASDCDVVVPGVGLATAQAIAFLGYLSLPGNARFCQARAATLAAAEALRPGSALERAAVALSWSAVGVADCPPAPSDFGLALSPRSIYLAPGQAGELTISLWQASDAVDVQIRVEGLPDGWYVLVDGKLELSVPVEVASASHVFSVVATSATRTERVYGVLLVDADGPLADVSPPSLALGSLVPSDGSGLPALVDWNAVDAGSGLAAARLEWSVDGGEWQDVTPSGAPGTRASVVLGAGAHSFRVLATDQVGNTAVSESSDPVSLNGVQESAATYSAGWSPPVSAEAWGTQRTTIQASRAATLRFSGSEVAWVAQRGPKRGRAKVYLDGVFVGRVDLYARAYAGRVVVFRAVGLAPRVEHSLRIVNLATYGRPRVGVDGFLVLSR